jgi:hypothetical protein
MSHVFMKPAPFFRSHCSVSIHPIIPFAMEVVRHVDGDPSADKIFFM